MNNLCKKSKMTKKSRKNNIYCCKKINSSHLMQSKSLINSKWTLKRGKPTQPRDHNSISNSQKGKREKTRKMKLLLKKKIKKMKLLLKKKMLKKQKLRKSQSRRKLFLKYLKTQTYRFLFDNIIFIYNYFLINC